MQPIPMERKVLAIIAIVFAALGLALSWVPIVNNFAFILGIVGLILALISVFMNRDRPKTLTWVGLGLSIATIIIVMLTQAMYANALNKASESIDESSKSISASIDKSVDETTDSINAATESINADLDEQLAELDELHAETMEVTQ